jgi:hypothetical protein
MAPVNRRDAVTGGLLGHCRTCGSSAGHRQLTCRTVLGLWCGVGRMGLGIEVGPFHRVFAPAWLPMPQAIGAYGKRKKQQDDWNS